MRCETGAGVRNMVLCASIGAGLGSPLTTPTWENRPTGQFLETMNTVKQDWNSRHTGAESTLLNQS